MHLEVVPYFGIWNPNIKEAAELVAVDMWFSGMIEDVKEPDDFDGEGTAPWLIAALANFIAAFEARLSAAVDSGRLKASFVRRSLDEKVIPEETHIDYDSLVDWLEERGHEPGDHMSEWVLTEGQICGLVCDEVIFLRAAQRSGCKELDRIDQQRSNARFGIVDDDEQPIEVRAVLKAKDEEIFWLKDELALLQSGRLARVDRPLHTRQRRTLLTIIAALCKAAKINYTEVIAHLGSSGRLDGRYLSPA